HLATHAAHVVDEVLPLGGRPHQRCDDLRIAGAELFVSGDRSGFEQCLELPGAGPLLVVGLVPVEGAHQRTGLAFGAEGGVDLEAGGPDQTHHRAGDASGHVQIAFGYEDDVDIADVVEFAPPGLAHGDHRQLGGVVRFGAGFVPCDVQPNAEGGFGESGEAPGDLGV